MKKLMMITLLAITLMANNANAQKPVVIVSDKTGWHRIGRTIVDFKNDRDEIIVLGSDRFAAIKFIVRKAPIYLMDLEVYYESGDVQKVNVNLPVKSQGESAVIDLKGGERNIKKIVFIYKTMPNRKDRRGHVEIWGLKTNADR